MKKSAVVVALAALGFIATEAMAQQSPWLVRARAVHIDTANKSDAIPTVAPANGVTVSNKTIPELDISYFFTPNIAAELILTYPQKHDVKLNGTKIGTFKHLPPTLSLQYHFTPEAKFSPYVGAGINYTRISSEKLGGLKLENDSLGYALQAGFDYKIDKNWSINFDVKKVQIRADVTLGGTKITEVKVDPLLVGVGIGYRF